MKTIAERVRWARERRGLSCAELDEVSDLSLGHTAAIESGRRESPSIPTCLKLAKGLGVDGQWIIFGGKTPDIKGAA